MRRMRYDPTALDRFLKQHGWSLEDLARRSGVKKMTIHQIRRGYNRPRADTLAALANALGVSVNAFFTRDSET